MSVLHERMDFTFKRCLMAQIIGEGKFSNVPQVFPKTNVTFIA